MEQDILHCKKKKREREKEKKKCQGLGSALFAYNLSSNALG